MPTLVTVHSGSTVVAGNVTGSYQSFAGLTGSNISSSFLIFTTRVDSNQPLNHLFSGKIHNSNTLRFHKNGTTGANPATINWQVAEFQSGSGVVVYRGEKIFPVATPANALIPLPYTYDLTKSFPISTYSMSGSGMGEDDNILTRFSSSTDLFITNEMGSVLPSHLGGDGPLMWETVEYSNCIVQTGSIFFNDVSFNIALGN